MYAKAKQVENQKKKNAYEVQILSDSSFSRLRSHTAPDVQQNYRHITLYLMISLMSCMRHAPFEPLESQFSLFTKVDVWIAVDPFPGQFRIRVESRTIRDNAVALLEQGKLLCDPGTSVSGRAEGDFQPRAYKSCNGKSSAHKIDVCEVYILGLRNPS